MNNQEKMAKQKRMVDAVSFMQTYMNTYTNQEDYENYSDETFIKDVLYGLGLSLNHDEYRCAQGFDKLKEKLKNLL